MLEKDSDSKSEVIQHPAQATHMALPADVMNDLITAVGKKYTWLEIDSLMTKIKVGMQPLHIAKDNAVLMHKSEVPK